MARRLTHPNIIQGYGNNSQSLFIIMEYMNAGNLHDYLNSPHSIYFPPSSPYSYSPFNSPLRNNDDETANNNNNNNNNKPDSNNKNNKKTESGRERSTFKI